VPASGDSEDDCGEQIECRLAGETEVLGENLPQRHLLGLLVNSLPFMAPKVYYYVR
jgi:hypothetical protein